VSPSKGKTTRIRNRGKGRARHTKTTLPWFQPSGQGTGNEQKPIPSTGVRAKMTTRSKTEHRTKKDNKLRGPRHLHRARYEEELKAASGFAEKEEGSVGNRCSTAARPTIGGLEGWKPVPGGKANSLLYEGQEGTSTGLSRYEAGRKRGGGKKKANALATREPELTGRRIKKGKKKKQGKLEARSKKAN